MAACTNSMLLMETCVAAGEADEVYPFDERAGDPDNAIEGHGCRATRRWIRRELASNFAHVYVPFTQPWHEEFPLDWTNPELANRTLIRAVFVASHHPIPNSHLTEQLLRTQWRA